MTSSLARERRGEDDVFNLLEKWVEWNVYKEVLFLLPPYICVETNPVLALLSKLLLCLLLDFHLEVIELESLHGRLLNSGLHAACQSIDALIEQLIGHAQRRILSSRFICLLSLS